MKKVFIMAAAIALTLASCGSKTQNNTASSDSTAAEAVDTTAAEGTAETAADDAALTDQGKAEVAKLTADLQKAIETKDSKAAATTLASLQTTYKKLVEEGKIEEAKAYGNAIKKIVDDNAEAIKNVAEGNTTVLQLVEGVKNLPTSAEATAEQIKSAINNAPATAKAAAEAAATKAVSDAKTAAENKVNSEVNKAADKVNAAKEAAKQKAQEKVNEAKQKANEAVNNAANKAIKDLLK